MTGRVSFALVTFALVAGAAGAQEKKVPTPLNLQVVYSRFQGEKKVSSVPYVLSVNADDRPARLRMGIMVPLTGTKEVPGQIVYRDVGNNIDCSAETQGVGRFKLMCSFEQSSLSSLDAERGSAVAKGSVSIIDTAPLIRTFRSEANLILRDGQSLQHTAATDPVTGEVLKIDVTLSVVK